MTLFQTEKLIIQNMIQQFGTKPEMKNSKCTTSTAVHKISLAGPGEKKKKNIIREQVAFVGPNCSNEGSY